MLVDDDTWKRLINIAEGVVLEGEEDTCTAIRNILCASYRTSATVKKDFESRSSIKKEQAESLRRHNAKRNWGLDHKPLKQKRVPCETLFNMIIISLLCRFHLYLIKMRNEELTKFRSDEEMIPDHKTSCFGIKNPSIGRDSQFCDLYYVLYFR